MFKTLARIKKYNFSIGIFAPAWTFEAVTEHGVNIFSKNGTDICNSHFMDRNNIFWSMLWEYFYTSGPLQLPFYSSFCLGSGKQRYQDGVLSSDQSWFNLSYQSWQPSVPISSAERYFDESFSGGSCIKILQTIEPIRLFVTDFSCRNNVILSYAIKADVSVADIAIMLNVVNIDSKRYCRIFCGNENVMTVAGERHFVPLENRNLQKTLIFISQRHEKSLPSFNPINGWEIRYGIIFFY